MIADRALSFSPTLACGGLIAHMIMSDNENNGDKDDIVAKDSMKAHWETGQGARGPALSEEEQSKIGPRKGEDAKLPLYFKPSEFDLFANKDTGEIYVFHGPELPRLIERMELKDEDSRINVYTQDGGKYDLGMKVQWLLRPYFKRADKVYVVQTRDGEALEGYEIPMSLRKKSE